MSDAAVRRHRANQRKKFEGWMRKYWGGIDLAVQYHMRHEFEYREAAAQTAWEVWQRFNKLDTA
jgi:hypothetical protein